MGQLYDARPPVSPTAEAEALAKAYQHGYRAGQRRKTLQHTEAARVQRENALWHRYMAEALTVCIDVTGWAQGAKPINSLAARTALAADFADEAIRLARNRGRI